ncbi:MAG: 3-isopropylmalate dehydratase small subunit [Promethearchaeati archaeon SRVP18_Atabeyarchaeia-1]
MEGRVWRFGDNVNTDEIIPAKYKLGTMDMAALARHAMEGSDPNFAKKARSGDIIVAGSNFGCGSSREQAPHVLKEFGIASVVARSFARIFYRNSINIAFPIFECDKAYDGTAEGDRLFIDPSARTIKNARTGKSWGIKPIPPFLERIFEDGGLVAHFKKHGSFEWAQE